MHTTDPLPRALAAADKRVERRIRLDEHQVLARLNEPGITKDELLRRIGERYRELDKEGR